MHSGVAQKTKRLQGQSNLNAWEVPRDNHTHTHQTQNNPAHNKNKHKKPYKKSTHNPPHNKPHKTKTPNKQLSHREGGGAPAHPRIRLNFAWLALQLVAPGARSETKLPGTRRNAFIWQALSRFEPFSSPSCTRFTISTSPPLALPALFRLG